MNLEELNNLNDIALYQTLEKCCGSSSWIIGMMNQMPFQNVNAIFSAADNIWHGMDESDGREAFEHHPKIGDKESLKEKFASTKEWAGNEQSGVDEASDELLDELKSANQEYFDKFGYIFIVFATGKSAKEMLSILQERLQHSPQEEIEIAMKEQHKITRIRLNKLLTA